MALIVESGSIVQDAVSFVTVAEARAFAGARALDLPADDVELEAVLVQAGDYINGLESRFRGSRVDPGQTMAWPREGATSFGFPIQSDFIPKNVRMGQIYLASDLAAGVDLDPTESGREVAREKVGAIETEYTSGSSSAAIPRRAFATLSVLFKSTAGLTVSRA